MITSTQALELQRVLRGQTRGNGDNGPLADALDQLYFIACDLTDRHDIYAATEDLVAASCRARDEADQAIMDEQADREASEADDKRDEMVAG